MSQHTCVVKQIRDYSIYKGEVYAFVNIIKKRAYVGETGEGESRELEHARCIFGLANSSNQALINGDGEYDKCYCLMHLYLFPEKIINVKQYYALETIYMYLFVKHGFQLYNAKDKDNLGKKRNFLFAKMSDDERLKELLAFLRDYPLIEKVCDDNSSSPIEIKNWHELISIAEKTFLDDIYNMFNQHIETIVKGENKYLITLWNNFLKVKKNDANFIILDKMNSDADFFVFNKKKLQNLLTETQIKSISLKELLEKGQLDTIIYSKIGDYLGESAYQILQNKLMDLNENIKLEFESKSVHACFWSLAGNQQEWLQTSINERKKENEFYMILSYTGSKNLSGATDKTAQFYSLDQKIYYSYPNKYRPEYISSRSSMSFLISELYYCEENITREVIEEAFTAIFKCGKSKKIKDCSRQKPFFLAELRNTDKNNLKKKLENAVVDSNKTGLIIAKVVSPFVVAVSDTPKKEDI